MRCFRRTKLIEDKAGWGLVGLQAPLLHIHTAAAAQWAAPTTAGLGWAGLHRSSPEHIVSGERREAQELR